MPDSTITPPLAASARDGVADTRRPSYFELRHLGFVNWYAFFKEDIRIDGRTAILGHNGAGKSAILDALQTVLTGNDRSRLRLNASVQNDEIARITKSRRSVRNYCLGAIDDVETESNAEGTTLLREQAITYLLSSASGTRRRTACCPARSRPWSPSSANGWTGCPGTAKAPFRF